MDSYSILKRGLASGYRWGYPPHFESTRAAVRVIMGLNIAVFGAWTYASTTRNEKWHRYLTENALLSWAHVRANHYWTVVTSAFSHKAPMHILFNMVSLNAFAGVLYTAGGLGLGPFHIFALTLGSAVTGSLGFLYYRQLAAKQKDGRLGPYGQHLPSLAATGLGASGVVMGFAAAATCIAPFQPMMAMMIPVPVPMWVLTGIYFALDAFMLGINDSVGHDAHLGGAVFGLAYYMVALRRFGGVSQLLRRGGRF